MNRIIHERLARALMLVAGFSIAGVGLAAEEAPAAQEPVTQKAEVKTEALPATATIAPEPINISSDPAAFPSSDILSVRDSSTVRASTDHEILIMNLVHRFNDAVRNNNLPEAEAQLKIMKQLLPDQSLTLLRMRAWYALSANEEAEARKLYQQLLDRVTNDENAGINLAILEARAGRIDEAKVILNNLANHSPDSEQLNAVRQAFGLVHIR